MTLQSNKYTEGSKVSDLIHWESHRAYNYVSQNVQATTAVTDKEILGQPVRLNGANWEFVAIANIASATHIVAEQRKTTLALNAKLDNVLLLERGPAMVLKTGYPAETIYGEAMTATQYEVILDGMSPLVKVFVDDITPKRQGIFG